MPFLWQNMFDLEGKTRRHGGPPQQTSGARVEFPTDLFGGGGLTVMFAKKWCAFFPKGHKNTWSLAMPAKKVEKKLQRTIRRRIWGLILCRQKKFGHEFDTMKGAFKGPILGDVFFGFAASPTKCSSFGCLFVCCVEVLKKELGHKFLKINMCGVCLRSCF